MIQPDPDALQASRETHVGRLLQNAARNFNARALAGMHALGHTQLTPAHLNLLPYLDVQGGRITTLAERAGMTKQAAGQLVAELEARGYLTRQADPTDGRAARIVFTELGTRFLLDAQTLKREIEAEYRVWLGPELWDALQAALTLLAGATSSV
ncbi:MarR family transcriptional regulator [Deinococcus sp.]|uniref:MarR family winged helix-turn-helix transcriptional regulator n=1 Tax=Deinococcus sp. TaxID=47478 RepID=UPI002869CA4C|nr:MarR family transcriptional regulator [Deinococcus sp.]